MILNLNKKHKRFFPSMFLSNKEQMCSGKRLCLIKVRFDLCLVISSGTKASDHTLSLPSLSCRFRLPPALFKF